MNNVCPNCKSNVNNHSGAESKKCQDELNSKLEKLNRLNLDFV